MLFRNLGDAELTAAMIRITRFYETMHAEEDKETETELSDLVHNKTEKNY